MPDNRTLHQVLQTNYLQTLRRDDGDVYDHTGDPNQGKAMVVNREWKYVSDMASDSEILYDMENDPKERTNIAAKRTETRERLKVSLQSHLSDIEDGETEVLSSNVSGDVET